MKVTLRRLTGCDAIALSCNICEIVNINDIRFLYEAAKKELSLSVRNPEAKENLMRLIIASRRSRLRLGKIIPNRLPSPPVSNLSIVLTRLKMPTQKNRVISSTGMLLESGLKDLLMRPTATEKRGLSILSQPLAGRRFRCIHAL